MRIIPKLSLTLDDIKHATDAIASYTENVAVIAITTDSREVRRGDLFIALSGENFDGESFVKEARNKGAYILSSKYPTADFKVKNTLTALLNIAGLYKKRLPRLNTTVAITGSVGKTTTKNILCSILSHCFKVHATRENYNNAIGLWHTILSAPIDTEVMIAELGMNHIGEIQEMSFALKPDIAIITNVGTAHIGNLGSREQIARAKLEILDGMTCPHLIAPYEENLLSLYTLYTFSTENQNADCYIRPLNESAVASSFEIITKNHSLGEFKISVPGRHILKAIAASVGAIEFMGADLKILYDAIPHLLSECARGRFIKIGAFEIYDDTYGSSPEAVIADFELLALTEYKTKSCMLGDMLELGAETEELHEKIGSAAFKYGYKSLFAFGRYAEFIKNGAIKAGMSEKNIFINGNVDSPEITAKQIINNTTDGELILFKASHAIAADRIYDYLK